MACLSSMWTDEFKASLRQLISATIEESVRASFAAYDAKLAAEQPTVWESSAALVQESADEMARRRRHHIEQAEDRARRDPVWAEKMARRHAAFRDVPPSTAAPAMATSTSTAPASILTAGAVRDGDLDLASPTTCSSLCPGGDTSVVAASMIASMVLGEAAVTTACTARDDCVYPMAQLVAMPTPVPIDVEDYAPTMATPSEGITNPIMGHSPVVDFVISASNSHGADDHSIANKHEVALPLKLLELPPFQTKEQSVSSLLPHVAQAMVSVNTSMNHLEAKINGMCSGLSYPTTNSITISLFQWDPGEQTRASRNLVVSRDITLAAYVNELNEDSSGSSDHYKKPGYGRNHPDFPWFIQLSCSGEKAISKCSLKGICLELLQYQFGGVGPFTKQYEDCPIAYAPAYPAISAEHVPFEDFLLESFCAVESSFQPQHPEAYQPWPSPHGKQFSGLHPTLLIVTGHSFLLFPWNLGAEFARLLDAVRPQEHGFAYGQLLEPCPSGEQCTWTSNAIHVEILTISFALLRCSIGRPSHFFLTVQFLDTFWLIFSIRELQAVDSYGRRGRYCRCLGILYEGGSPRGSEIFHLEIAWSSLLVILGTIQSSHEISMFYSPTAVLLLIAYGIATLTGPMEQLDPGIHICIQHSHVPFHPISTAVTTERAHNTLSLSQSKPSEWEIAWSFSFLCLDSMSYFYLEPWPAFALPSFPGYLTPSGFARMPWTVALSFTVVLVVGSTGCSICDGGDFLWAIAWSINNSSVRTFRFNNSAHLSPVLAYFLEESGYSELGLSSMPVWISMWFLQALVLPSSPGCIAQCCSQLMQWHIAWPFYPPTHCCYHYLDQDPVGYDYYISLTQVHSDDNYVINYGYHDDPTIMEENQVPWNPGGLTWHRLEVKPNFKEGGMLARLLSSTPLDSHRESEKRIVFLWSHTW